MSPLSSICTRSKQLPSLQSVILEFELAMKKIYFLLGLLVLSYWLACVAMATTNVTTDQLAILSLRDKITFEPYQILANNWSVTSSVCDWIGVTCGSRHRRVTALNISNMGLTGTIPSQLGNLSFLVSLDMSRNNFHGELPYDLANLRRLTLLSLGFNNLGGELPSRFGDLQKLHHLSLRNNSFTGFIPASIYNLSNLEILWLSSNSLEGMIPKSISKYQNLKSLKISYNMLYGSLPFEIFNISSLEVISFSGNSLSGSLPVDICSCLQRLTWLDLSLNLLSGQVPSKWSPCSKLQVLYLYSNNFSGPIPKDIGNLKLLEELYLDNNNLEGTIPQELGNPHKLENLDLSFNSLTGSIPVQIFNISMLQNLSLQADNLSGSLPSTMGYGLINLELLEIDRNNLDGVIPVSISNASKLSILSLYENKFSGPIPNSLGDLRLLRLLLLEQNNLTSETSSAELSFINYLTNCKYLKRFGFSDNPLHGTLPISSGNLSTSLVELYAYRCEIKGKILEGIGNLSNLLVLSLFENHLSGAIPATIKELQKLQALDFQENQLSGSLSDVLCDLKSLYAIFLGKNHIRGSIPSCLGNVTTLRKIGFGGNLLNSSIPASLWNLNDLLKLDLSSNFLSGLLPQEIQNLKVVINLDLSRNHIYGNIPSSIASLQSLIDLSLAQNRLEGPIPDSLSHILSLEFLDLSNNHLSGPIPKSLETLSHLIYINLSFNNLNGEIPSSGPFKNFTHNSFMSNGELCGAQRFHVPPCSTSSIHRANRKKIFEVIGILLGIVATMLATIAAILFLRYRRKDDVPRTTVLMPMGVPKRISYYELFQATNGYDDSYLLGRGSFGSVYRGMLDGILVAVKVFSLPREGTFKSFDRECEVLRKFRHRNLTKVIGSWSNIDFKASVLDYMPNGSLEKWLYSHNHFLDLMQRISIMIDVASALQYLHYGNTTTVVHCDLKPSNILLDDDMVAHVSDFGIAKFLDEKNSTLHTKTLATLGYVAPEYGRKGQVSTGTDVYSFGIVVMETFSRKKPNDDMFFGDVSLKSWIEDSLLHATIQVIDANLLQLDDMNFTKKLEYVSMILKLALNCCNECPGDRINMQDVVISLQKIKCELDAI